MTVKFKAEENYGSYKFTPLNESAFLFASLKGDYNSLTIGDLARITQLGFQLDIDYFNKDGRSKKMSDFDRNLLDELKNL